MNITDALSKAITAALNKSGRSTLIAIPLALAPCAIQSFAQSHQFSIKTAEDVISTYRSEKTEREGLIVYEYFPFLMKKEENELFMTRLQAYACTDKAILLFLLLTQDSPTPNPFILKLAWETKLFKTGAFYEVAASWEKVSLYYHMKAGILGQIPLGWSKKQMGEWEPRPLEQETSVKRMAIISD